MALPNWVKKIAGNIPFTIKRPQGPIEFGREGIRDVKGISATLGGGSDPFAIWRPGSGKSVDASKAMAAYAGLVYACVNAIAREIAQMQFKLYSINEDGSVDEIEEHELLDLLDGVNERQTGPEFKYTIGEHLELCGNAYILLNGVSKDTDKPDSMFLLDPSAVKIIYDKTMYPYQIKGYKFTIENKEYFFKPYEIVHLKYPDPNDFYAGIGAVQAIAPWIDGDNDAMELNRQMFIKGTKLGIVLQSDSNDEAMLERLRITWDSTHQGVANAHRPLILPKGVTLANTTLLNQSKDMDMPNFMEEMRKRIMLGFGVSQTILGTAEADTNRATAETADYIFSHRVIKPKLQQIVSYLNEFLVPRYGDNIYLGFLDPTPEDKSFRTLEMQAVMANGQVLTLNETREKFQGLGPVEGGDKIYISQTMQPVGSPIEEEHTGPTATEDGKPVTPQNKPTKSKKNKKDVGFVKTRYARNAERRRKLADAFADKFTKKLEEIKAKKTNELTDEEYYIVYQKFTERVDEYIKKIKDEVLQFNSDQKETVLENLKKLYGDKAVRTKVDIKDLFNKDEWTKAMIDMVGPILIDLARQEGEQAAAGFGKPGYDILNDVGVKQSIDQSIELLSQKYNETTLADLETQLTEGLGAGESIDKLIDRVQGVYEFSNSVRASMVAITETNRIANYSIKVGWKESGVTTIKWYTAEDSDVCDLCEELDGKVISVEENFFDKGDSYTTESGKTYNFDYSDVGAPPGHVNCRCYERPESWTPNE